MNLPDINITPTLTGKEIHAAFWRIKNFENKYVRKVIKILDEHGELTVYQLRQIMNLDQSGASQVLARARRCGCVKTKREGKYIKYSLDKNGILRIEALRATIGFDRLWVLNHKGRIQIINYLIESPGATVTDVYVKMRIEQSVASKFLSYLLDAGIVLFEQEKNFHYYYVSKEELKRIKDAILRTRLYPA